MAYLVFVPLCQSGSIDGPSLQVGLPQLGVTVLAFVLCFLIFGLQVLAGLMFILPWNNWIQTALESDSGPISCRGY